MTMTALELDDLLQRYQRPTALPTTRGTPFAPPGPEPEARSYTPPWYDRMSDWATALLHGPDANAQQRAGVHHILGPENPLNLPAQFSEGFNTAKQGYDLGNAGMIGLGSLGMAMALPIGAPKPKGIRAYHGSPHDFDKFDLSKIGTGEGAQAYGPGLYFAGDEAVAKSYRDNLGGYEWGHVPNRIIDGFDVSDDVKRALDQSNGNPNRAREILVQNQKHFAGTGRDEIDAAAIKLFDEIAPTLAGTPKGRMYEVNIKAHPEDFLDWDKPLSQQSEKIREAVRRIGLERYSVRGPDGYDMVSNRNGKMVTTFPEDEARRMAAEAGGTVVPDSARASVLFKGKDAPFGPSEIAKKLREAGVAGTQYLDQGSRHVGHGTRNYVVFDDALIEILRKYGLAGIMAGAGAAGAGGNAEAKP